MDNSLDLFRPADAQLAGHVLSAWKWLFRKDYSVIGTSVFGDVFLKDNHGLIDMLDLVSGEVKQVAYCVEEFEYELNGESARREWLMEPLVRKLITSGLRAGVGECYAFKTPPALGGELQPENVVVWDALKYHSGLSSVFRQAAGLPPGTEVRVVPPSNP
jgi:hypothetical protein